MILEFVLRYYTRNQALDGTVISGGSDNLLLGNGTDNLLQGDGTAVFLLA